MGHTGGWLGKNGQGIIVPITPKMKSPRIGLGYNVASSLHTPSSAKNVLFVFRGIQTKFLEEWPTTNFVRKTNEMVVPNIPEFEKKIAYDIFYDVQGCFC